MSDAKKQKTNKQSNMHNEVTKMIHSTPRQEIISGGDKRSKLWISYNERTTSIIDQLVPSSFIVKIL